MRWTLADRTTYAAAGSTGSTETFAEHTLALALFAESIQEDRQRAKREGVWQHIAKGQEQVVRFLLRRGLEGKGLGEAGREDDIVGARRVQAPKRLRGPGDVLALTTPFR